MKNLLHKKYIGGDGEMGERMADNKCILSSPVIRLNLLLSKEPLSLWFWLASEFKIPAQVFPTFDHQVLHAVSNKEWFYKT